MATSTGSWPVRHDLVEHGRRCRLASRLNQVCRHGCVPFPFLLLHDWVEVRGLLLPIGDELFDCCGLARLASQGCSPDGFRSPCSDEIHAESHENSITEWTTALATWRFATEARHIRLRVQRHHRGHSGHRQGHPGQCDRPRDRQVPRGDPTVLALLPMRKTNR